MAMNNRILGGSGIEAGTYAGGVVTWIEVLAQPGAPTRVRMVTHRS